MQPNERRQYEKSLFDYNDINNSNVKHFREGREEGLKEGKEVGAKEKTMEIARNLKAAGVNIAVIQSTTGLSKEEIEEI